MKTRDAAFMVDHRRQVAASAPPPSKNDEQTLLKKKKSATARAKQPGASAGVAKPTPQSALAAAPKKPAVTTTTAAAATPAKKNATKQQGKAAKKDKQQVKQQAAGGKAAAKDAPSAVAASAAASPSAAIATALDPDGLKSRNHTLFLAPSCGAAATAKSLPSWGNARKDASKSDSVTQRLHAEILEYAQYTRHTVDAMAVHIEEMIANVRECVQSLWPRSKVETFGSYSTGIWLPSSDVDLVILDVVEVNDVLMTVTNLRRLAKALEAQTWVHSLVLLDTAKIPVLKLVSADTTRVPIDITFESSATHSGLIARDLVKRYAQELPELYPLAVVFKQLLRERDLNDAYTGGLSSYSIVLMIIHFAQLWRNGDRCFQAASIYASGSLPPAPSTLAAAAAADAKAVDTKAESKAANNTTSVSDAGSPVKKQQPVATPTSSYAAIVSSQPKPQLARVDSETQTGKKTESSLPSTENSAPVQRFSYAAVAAGIVKVSEDDATAKKNALASSAPAASPSSYAAAVAAAVGSKSSSAVVKKASSVLKPGVTASSPSAGISETQLDAVSVTSSSADTEDSCSSSSSSSSSSAADSDEETSEKRYVCLGEHTMLLLEFFGIIFDYRKNGLSIRDGGYIYRLAEHPGSQLSKPALVIEDPIHPDRNVSASSFAFSKVVAVFEDSYYALKYHRPTKFTPSALSCLLSSSGHTSHHSPPKSIASR